MAFLVLKMLATDFFSNALCIYTSRVSNLLRLRPRASGPQQPKSVHTSDSTYLDFLNQLSQHHGHSPNHSHSVKLVPYKFYYHASIAIMS